MKRVAIILLAVASGHVLARQDCGVSVVIVYPEDSCVSQGRGMSVRIAYPEDKCTNQYRARTRCDNTYESRCNQCNSCGKVPNNPCDSVPTRAAKTNEEATRERVLAAARELDRRERVAVEAAERCRFEKFLEDQKQVQVPTEKDEFAIWKALREHVQERNAFAEWRETYVHKDKPKESLGDNESFIQLLKGAKKKQTEAPEQQKKREEDEEE
jgi:hypothetical protein